MPDRARALGGLEKAEVHVMKEGCDTRSREVRRSEVTDAGRASVEVEFNPIVRKCSVSCSVYAKVR